jgi:hypothetical protein
MATHSENKQPNTIITNSPINVNTLNVNKTSTQEAVLLALPQYYLIDLSTGSSPDYIYNLNPAVNPEFATFFKVFINGNLIPTVVNPSDEGISLLPNANQFQVIGSQYTSLLSDPNVIMHALYTKI